MKSLKKSSVLFTCVKRTYWGFTEIGDSLGTMGKTSKKLTAVFIPPKSPLMETLWKFGALFAHLLGLYRNWGLPGDHGENIKKN
jgi:hypothetical protein